MHATLPRQAEHEKNQQVDTQSILRIEIIPSEVIETLNSGGGWIVPSIIRSACLSLFCHLDWVSVQGYWVYYTTAGTYIT